MTRIARTLVRNPSLHRSASPLAILTLGLCVLCAACQSSASRPDPGRSGSDAGTPVAGDDAGAPRADASQPTSDAATGPDATPPTADASGQPDATPPPPAHDYSATLTPFTVDPHGEIIYCQYFPASGVRRWVNKFIVDMSVGSHHLVVFRIDETQGATPPTELHECSQLDIPPGLNGMLPGAQTPHTEVALPDGVAMLLDATEGVYLQSHYINASDQPIQTSVVWSIDTLPEAQVVNKAGMIFWGNYQLDIPAHATVQQSDHCTVPFQLNLLGATGHMHKHGTAFDADIDGMPIYHADTWDGPPMTQFAPPMAVAQGQTLTWTCSYVNDTDSPLYFGNSAEFNEMCIFVGIYYPSPTSSTLFRCNGGI